MTSLPDSHTPETSNNTRTSTKYGDSDLVSKRRKILDQTTIYQSSSPTRTVHSSPVKTICHNIEYNQFEKPILDDIHNSTFNENDLYAEANNDFKGGLIDNNAIQFNLGTTTSIDTPTSDKSIILKSISSQTNSYSLDHTASSKNSNNSFSLITNNSFNTSNDNCHISQNNSSNDYITKFPSSSSCGFENTFKILEKQINAKKLFLPKTSTTIPPYLRKISEESLTSSIDINTTNDDEIDEEYQPTLFELELKAMERVKELSSSEYAKRLNNKSIVNDEDTVDNVVKIPETTLNPLSSCINNIPFNNFLYGLKPFQSNLTCNQELCCNHKNDMCKNNDSDIRETDENNYCNLIARNVSSKTLATDTTPSNSCTNNEETLLEFCNQTSDISYHIARGKDGKQYLKILSKVLCGNRVSQMTRTYDDIEAVTRLLEEKEKDLELTVQIGKELLTQNNRLENRITELEQELKLANEDRAQLAHDLHQKNELISVLTNDVDDGSEAETPTVTKSITFDLLQRKISSLQDENKSLKMEASQLAKQTDEVEEQERKLMEDITSQLNSAHSNYDGLSLELERQKEENRLQHEQIVSLTARLAEAEMRLHQLTAENDEQVSLLSITKENQNLLAAELAEFKQRYQEVLALLQEAQEYMRKNRKKQQPHARSSFIPGIGGMPQPDSLHTELMESSMYSENSLDSGICVENRLSSLGINNRLNVPNGAGGGGLKPVPPYKKVFETVQCASKNGNYSDSMSQLSTMSLSSSSGPRMSTMPYTGYGNPAGSYHRPSSVYSGSTYPSYDSSSLGLKTMSCESLASQSDDGYPQQPSGVPGAPGAKDLEAALKRLTPAEVLARRAMLSHAPVGTYNYDEQNTKANVGSGLPLGLRTPDSIMSTGSSRLSNISDTSLSERSNSTSNQSGNSSNQWRLPEKLQIVKPMEGSQTLGHWSRLATPTLSGLLEERPGVTIRGGRGLDDLGLQLYSLSDVEEDVDDLPLGKQFSDSSYTYTFTTSVVMHPDDGIVNDLSFLSQSQLSSRMASTSTSRQPSCPQTPHTGLSRRNSCSTFSVNMGLASMLNERGIKAVTPSALNTPAGPNFSPTVTPCNSPEGSPPRSMSPEPLFGLLSSGADMIRRKLVGDNQQQHQRNAAQNKQQKIMLSRLEKRALRSLRLLEKVESVGLENIIATQPNAMTQLACGIASRSSSPMAQLTSLKHLQAINNGMVDDLQFDRNQIRAVLNKGLSSDSLKNLEQNDQSDGNPETFIMSNNQNQSSKNAQIQDKVSSKYSSQIDSTPSLDQIHINKEDDLKVAQSGISNSSTISSAADIRIKQMQRQKSRRNLKNGQRPDLGTVNTGRIRPDLGKVEQRNNINTGNSEANSRYGTLERRTSNQQNKKNSFIINDDDLSSDAPVQQSMTQSFVGSISSLFFGRKGGWL